MNQNYKKIIKIKNTDDFKIFFTKEKKEELEKNGIIFKYFIEQNKYEIDEDKTFLKWFYEKALPHIKKQ